MRRLLARALVTAFCIAGLTAIAAIVGGEVDDTEVRLIAVSLGFAVFSATASCGASLRIGRADHLRALGLATVGLSAGAFVLLAWALWDDGADDAWRWFGAVALAALAGSHTSLVTSSRRDDDRPTVRTLATLAIGLGAVDTAIGIAVITGQGPVGEGVEQLAAVLVVSLILATILTPILRRLQSAPAAPVGRNNGLGLGRDTLAASIVAAVARIETLSADAGDRAPEIRRECERLRALAHEHLG